MILPGNHSARHPLYIEHVSNITIKGSDNATILCMDNFTIRWHNVTYASINRMKFVFLYEHDRNLRMLDFFKSIKIIISNSIFQGKVSREIKARAVHLDHSNITIIKCFFRGIINDVAGAIVGANQSHLTLIGNTFIGNIARYSGGVITVINITHSTLNRNIFFNNHAADSGGSIAALYENHLKLIGNKFFRNNAGNFGGAISVSGINYMILLGNDFTRNVAKRSGGAIMAFNVNYLKIIRNNFTRNTAGESGGALSLYTVDKNPVLITGNIFIRQLAKIGGAISVVETSITLSGTPSNHFSGNVALSGGAVHVENDSTIHILDSSYFYNNTARNGGALHSYRSSVIINGTNVSFVSNRAVEGGGVYILGDPRTNTASTLISPNFIGNYGLFGSAVQILFVRDQNVTIKNSTITHCRNNTVRIMHSSIMFEGISTFTNNNAYLIQVMTINNSTVLFYGDTIFENNQGTVIGTNHSIILLIGRTRIMNNIANFTNIILIDTSIIFDGSTLICNHFTNNSGGAIHSIRGKLRFIGTTSFINNTATREGGALNSLNTVVVFKGNTSFRDNSATLAGGGTSSQYGSISFTGIITFTANRAGRGGGALNAISTAVTFEGMLKFSSNSARTGGAMYFINAASLTLASHTTLETSHNSATDYGGAIFHKDIVTPSQCDNVIPSIPFIKLPYCFLELDDLKKNSSITINSYLDSAGIDGSFLYGGLLDDCRFNNIPSNALVEQLNTQYMYKTKGSHVYSLLEVVSLDEKTNPIASEAYLLCFCYDEHYNYECNITETYATIFRGQNINLNVKALGQRGSTVSTTVVAITSENTRMRVGQNLQKVSRNCSSLIYTLYSRNDSASLTIYPDGPCHDTGNAYKVIHVTFLPCPEAFNLQDDQCLCEEQLQPYNTECIIGKENFILKKNTAKFWMSILRDDNATYQGLILYPSCPPDYCKTSTLEIPIDDLDIQCGMNRMGVLCGQCATNYSLLLGTSDCGQCSNKYLALLFPFAVAGIALIMYLSFFKLTVATGMINSLILYANFVQVNRRLFFPTDSVNVLTVFIAWLNLDLGFQTCFFDGLDAYMQTWLQYAFPLYVWLLIGFMILSSRYSMTVSKLIGHNPVAVLATLILMSYTKILQVIIAVFSSVSLEYPHGKRVRVWLKDANVAYLHSKHLFLAVITLLVVIFFFLPYTVFLLLGTQLYRFSPRKCARMLLRIKPLLDSYFAPYKRNSRYWTGFLLLVRCVLYIVFSFNSLGDTNKSLLAIVVTFTGVGGIAWISGRVYKNFYIEIMESSIYLNLITLSAATLTQVNRTALVNVLVGIVFVNMIIITVYQFYLLYILKSKKWLKIKAKISNNLPHSRARSENGTFTDDVVPAKPLRKDEDKFVTCTVIQLREPLVEP